MIEQKHNPDPYIKGRRVKLSKHAVMQRLGNRSDRGTIVSKYPLRQMVTVQWDHRLTQDRFHVDLLDLEKSATAADCPT